MIHVLWDDAHFWGLMALKALTAWGLPHQLVRGTEIAQGVLSGNPGDLLLVPGGNARTKAQALGPAGMDAVRGFVEAGGAYLGLCGGAGLALSGDDGLGLCPWSRKPFADRLQHFLSGHIHLHLRLGHPLVPEWLGEMALAPIWWPGQFDEDDGGVEVLAAYGNPGPDFWVADLALKTLPEGTMAEWEDLYGVHLRPDFLRGRPCVASGRYGAGRWVLSYAHLETPASPRANIWFAFLLSRLAGGDPVRPPLAAWDPGNAPVCWDDPVLTATRRLLEQVIRTGQEHFLLFWRTPWLLGWRRGIPGAAVNSLYALVCEAQALRADAATREWWAEQAPAFATDMGIFFSGVQSYFLAERLAMTVYQGSAPLTGLKQQREALFGRPPGAGGQHLLLLKPLEELYFRLHRPEGPARLH